MAYNVDSACYYIIFYALGYYGFSLLQRFLDWKKTSNKAVGIGIGVVLFVYAEQLFFGKDLLDYINLNIVMNLICPILKALFIILFIFIISKTIENVELFSTLGKNTLYLCGSEHLIKLFVPMCLQIVGLNIAYPNPFATYIYAFVLLVLCNKVLVPIEKAVFKELHLLK